MGNLLYKFWPRVVLVGFWIILLQLVHHADTHSVNAQIPSHAELSLRLGSDGLLNSTRLKNPARMPFLLSGLDDNPHMSELLPSHSARITAVLPVTPLSISSLNAEISSILEHSTYLDQVVLLTPPTLLLQAKQSIRTFLGTWGTSGHVELTVSPWLTGTQDVASLRAARQTTSDFVLFLDDSGLQQTESHIREALLLLEPFSTTVPIGPYGFSDGQSLTCISSSEMPQPATFLIPPFVMPSTLFPSDDLKEETIFGIWRALGESIATPQRDSIGGFVIGPNNVSAPWCRSNKAGSIIETTEGYSFDISLDPTEQSSDQDATNETCDADSDYLRPALGFFLLVFSALTDLHNFSPAACRLQSDGHNVHVLLYDEGLCSPPQTSADTKILVLASCKLEYSVLPVGSEIEVPTSLEEWIQCHSLSADVILTTLSEEERFYLRMRSENGSTVIHIPSSDLPFCDWMGSLTLQEYKSKSHTPTVTVKNRFSVIQQVGIYLTLIFLLSRTTGLVRSPAFLRHYQLRVTSATRSTCV